MNYRKLTSRAYLYLLLNLVVVGGVFCWNFRVTPAQILLDYRGAAEICGRYVLGLILVVPVVTAVCVAHNRWERRLRLIVMDYGVWVERVGRESRLYRWSQIERAVNVRKDGCLGLAIRHKILPITISGFRDEVRERFVRIVNEGLRQGSNC